MLWFLYSLLSGFFHATSDAFAKKVKVDDEYVIAWSRFFFAIPVILVLLVFTQIPKLDSTFWTAMLFLAPLDVVLLIVYIKAIRVSPLSLTLPFFSTTPIFLILTSFLLLGELPSFLGILGILLVAVGAYMLNLSKRSHGFFGPLRAIAHEKGSMLMILAALIASITANLVKIVVQHSSPAFFAVFYPLAVLLILSAMSYRRIRKNFVKVKSNLIPLLLLGLTNGLMFLFHALAVVLVIVPYMISIKRISSIFGVLYGHFWFKEVEIRERLFGAVIMLLGAAIILLS